MFSLSADSSAGWKSHLLQGRGLALLRWNLPEIAERLSIRIVRSDREEPSMAA